MTTLSHRLSGLPPATRRQIRRFWVVAGAVSVRTKILGIVLGLVLVLGVGVTLQVRRTLHASLEQNLRSQGVSISRDVAARSVDLLLVHDLYGVYQLLQDTLTNNSDARYAFIVSPQGEVLAHTFGDRFPTGLLAANVAQPDERYHLQKLATAEGIVWDFATPIFEGQVGTARIGLSEQAMQETMASVTQQLLLTTVIVSLVGVAAAMFLTWLITRPVLDLVATTRQVGQGNLTARAPHWADDEIGDLADAFNQMVADLETSQQTVAEKEAARARLLAQLINAQEEERRRIARELHDGVGQSLTSLMVGLKLVNQFCEREAVQEKTAELRRITGETLDEVRLLSRQLRPSILDDLGLVTALERYADDFTGLYPGLTIDLHCSLPQRLPLPVETTLYRIIQEAMTNAARHSGGTALSVVLTARNGRIQAIIEDNGRGFDPETTRRQKDSVGLHSMVERAELVGGGVKIESSSKGTAVFVEVSL